MNDQPFTDEQKAYLEGFTAGAGLKRALSLPLLEPQPAGSEALARNAQDRFVAAGQKLSTEEQAKRAKNGLDLWDEVVAHAKDGRFPKGTDVFLFKFQGLFYVAPAQDAFMCRLRFPAGVVTSAQLRGLANLCLDYAGGYADVTTRANLQLREIGPRHTVPLLIGLSDLGIIPRGAGADNIRNITASPAAGIDGQELLDTRPFARELNHYILNHRELYGLPRKFNIAFDGGGKISALEDTNDIGFQAVRVREGAEIPAGIYFRLLVGGITGHKDFARDTGILLRPDDATQVSAAIVKAFIEHGDRTDRKKARLKYVLDKMGFDAFLAEVEKHLGSKLTRVPSNRCEPRPPVDRLAHVGVHPQKQSGLHYAGVVLPVGRITASQLKGLAGLADRFGSGQVRFTVWQNLLIPDVPTGHLAALQDGIESLGLDWRASSVRAGLVACTGSAGCKFAAADTKKHAMQIAAHLDAVLPSIDQPINIHLTGCHHSCAQHFIGDIGLIATKIPAGDDMLEGYHILVGGGYADQQYLARELLRDVPANDAPHVVERILRAWLDHRTYPSQSFGDFVRQIDVDRLKPLIESHAVAA